MSLAQMIIAVGILVLIGVIVQCWRELLADYREYKQKELDKWQ